MYCFILQILAIILIVHLDLVSSSLDDHPDSYWLTTDLLSVDWRKGCLTTAGCAEPRFQVTKVNMINNEANSISWPVTLKLAEETSHSFISHWTSGSMNDIALKCEIAGLDPTYGFPRICDSTATKRIFDVEHDHIQRPRKQQKMISNGKLVMELRAKCFNASLAVQKYDRCPTCIEHHSIAVVEQYTDPESNNDLLLRLGSSDQFLYALIILSAFTALLTIGFACLLTAYLHQKRRLKSSISKQRLHSEPLNTIQSLQTCQDESRYDVPWEQVATMHRRQSYRFLHNRNGFTSKPSTSPSLLGPISDIAALTRPDCRKTSPSSSFGAEPHDDSGLESV